MNFDPKYSGPSIDQPTLEAFERANQIAIPEPYAQFLLTATNGGSPVEELLIPVPSIEGGADILEILFGINHPNKHFDLGALIAVINKAHGPEWLEQCFPFGQDASGNIVVIRTFGVRKGQVFYYAPQEAYPGLFYIAQDFATFLEVLRPEDAE